MGKPPKPPAPIAPPPVPQVDDAANRRMQRDRMARRGRATTILTGESGLPDLGQTVTPMAR